MRRFQVVRWSRLYRVLGFAGMCTLICSAGYAADKPEKPEKPEKPVRELFVPFEDLHFLLNSDQEQRVLISREEYQALQAKAEKEEENRPPRTALLSGAAYTITIANERAEIAGKIELEVLDAGVHALHLDIGGVGLQAALLDDRAAAIGRNAKGQLQLMVEHIGKHSLQLNAIAPIETTAARQTLAFRLPMHGPTSLNLTIPGDVEVKSGAAVIKRVFDEAKAETRFELLAQRDLVNLVMSLNSRLKRTERAVIAQSVLVNEVTTAYERLHATISLDVLHRAVADFRFRLPDGLEITDVQSANLSRWEILEKPEGRQLEILMRDEASGRVTLNISGIRMDPDLDNWVMPQIEPLDVVGHVVVIGLLAEGSLKLRQVVADQLVSIDNTVLMQAIPQSFLTPDPGAAQVRALKAYYAPQQRYGLKGQFYRPEARLYATGNVSLAIEEQGLSAAGGFVLVPVEEKLFEAEFSVPAGWEVRTVTGASRQPLAFERYEAAAGAGRVLVRLPAGVPANEESRIFFTARHVPTGWFGEWLSKDISFPVFAIQGAERDIGALAVVAGDTFAVRATELRGLTPLDQNEKATYGMQDTNAALAFRYETPGYEATITVDAIDPRLTAEAYSFFTVNRESLRAHYEIIYNIEKAKTDSVQLVLPASTPSTLSITGLGGTVVKEFFQEVRGSNRVWTVSLNHSADDRVHVAADFLMPVDSETLRLPIVEAAQVAYQSGLLSVEGSPELNVEIIEHPRPVDIGELISAAEYLPGRRLLGAFGYVGQPEAVQIKISELEGYLLPPALVERAEISTSFSTSGRSQSAARFEIRSNADFLEVKLPADSDLWSVMLNGEATKPQQEGQSLLLELPPGRANVLRDLQLVYETPVASLDFSGRLILEGPRLFLHEQTGRPAREVPVTDLKWRVYVPEGYDIVNTRGTVVTNYIEPPQSAAVQVGEALYAMSGGVDPQNGLVGVLLMPFLSVSRSSLRYSDSKRDMAMDMEGADQASVEMPENSLADISVERNTPVPASPAIIAGRESARLQSLDLISQPSNEAASVDRAVPKPAPARKLSGKDWARKGLSSLKIDLASAGQIVEFKSLGEAVELDVKMIHLKRRNSLVWALAIAVFLLGASLSQASWKRRFSFIALILILASVLPALPVFLGWVSVLNGMFYAGCALIPFYLVAQVWLKIWGGIRRWGLPTNAAVIGVLIAGSFFFGSDEARAQEKSAVPYIPVPQPIKVPADAVVVPFDPSAAFDPSAGKLLIPYKRYELLWKLAHPEVKERIAPVPYAIAGAAYSTRLEGDEFLLIEGRLEIDVYSDTYVEIPFDLENGVFAEATLDGQPARLHSSLLSVKKQKSQPAQQRVQIKTPTKTTLIVSGRGRHLFEASIRMKVNKQGGWRRMSGRLPRAPASLLTLTVPGEGTEVNFRNVPDRPLYKTTRANEELRSTLGPNGGVDLQWRPRISEGEVDRTLTVNSLALFDVQEDHQRLTWHLRFEFRRVEREFFEIDVPEDYLVQKVEGLNVRGWEREEGKGRQFLKIRLLKRVKGTEAFTVYLRKEGSEAEAFEAPVVVVPDAIRHTGMMLIRRSPFMNVRTLSTRGINRTDLNPKRDAALIQLVKDESPLGIKPFEAYTFNTAPFKLELETRTVESRVTATFKTILRLGLREKNIECRMDLHIQDRPLHQFSLQLPAGFELESVSAPGTVEWEVSEQVLTLHFATGAMNRVPVLLMGRYGDREDELSVDLPVFKALDVQRQDGYLVIQSDPGYDVQTTKLQHVEHSLMSRVHGWLLGPQRSLARAALYYTAPNYAGTVTLKKRKPTVNGYTVSNARITDRTIEETLLLHFNIERAGIREVQFRLPAYLADSEISVPFLREKTIVPAPGFPDELLVTLTLQDEVMNQLRVLVEHDRVLTGSVQNVAIPTVLTGRIDRQYVARESAGRDEVITHEQRGLEPLTRQMKEWNTVAALLKGGTTEAWIVSPGAENPTLSLATKQRKKVETAGASIGLSHTLLIMDASGTYRARQTYQVDNRTEQFLAIELPAGAALWTARVAGEYVKPIQPDPRDLRKVHIPLVKTAAGDIDYEVVLKYGGKINQVSTFSQIDFPLIKTSRINVELSQVELRLPSTHTWHNFGGTMRHEMLEGQFEAGQLGYLNKQAEKLVQVLQYGDKFSKARAYSNLKIVQEQVRGNRESTVHLGDRNVDWGKAAQASDAILNQADEELKKVDKQAPSAVPVGNRWGFNGQFDGQKAVCSANMVNNSGVNFPIQTIVEALPAKNLVNFNGGWLIQNDLSNANVDDKATVVGGRLINPNVQVQAGNQIIELHKNAKYFNNRSANLSNAAPQQGQVKDSGAVATEHQIQKGKKINIRRGQQEAANRYQFKLESLNTVQNDGDGRLLTNEEVGAAPGGGGFGFGSGLLAIVPGGQAVGTGLASLDVQLPGADNTRWTTYRFTTPRGDIQVTARPASEQAISGLKRLGIVVAILLILGILRVMTRDRGLDHKGRKILSTTLILLGVAGLLIGIVPVFALVAIVAGIVMKVGLRRAATRRALHA